MTGAQWITEAQTFYLISDTGKYLFMQIAYSNLSWPAQTTCQMMVRFYDPERPGKSTGWHQHSAASKMKVSPDKRSVQIKQTSFQHDDNGAVRLSFEEGDEIQASFVFQPLSEPFSILDGNLHFGVNRTDGHINLKFMPFASVKGKITLDGVEEAFCGHGIGVHQFQGVKPYLSASRWNFVYFQEETEAGKESGVSAFMIQIKTPASYDSCIFNIGSVFLGGKLLGVSIGNTIEPCDPQRDPVSNYQIPTKFKYTWQGTTFGHEPFTVHCDTTPTNVVTKLNVLDNLPFFLRKAIEAFVTRPFAYNWLDRSELTLTIGGHESKVKGWLMQELSLINEDTT